MNSETKTFTCEKREVSPCGYTAIGIRYSDDGWTASTGVAEDTARKPQLVSNALRDQFSCCFEEILVMRNGDDGPVVAAIYVVGKHYDDSPESLTDAVNAADSGPDSLSL